MVGFRQGMDFDTGLLQAGGSQFPFQRTIEPSSISLFINLEQRDMQRLRRIEEHFFLGDGSATPDLAGIAKGWVRKAS